MSDELVFSEVSEKKKVFKQGRLIGVIMVMEGKLAFVGTQGFPLTTSVLREIVEEMERMR